MILKIISDLGLDQNVLKIIACKKLKESKKLTIFFISFSTVNLLQYLIAKHSPGKKENLIGLLYIKERSEFC